MARMRFCRACKNDRLYMFLELGSHPRANRTAVNLTKVARDRGLDAVNEYFTSETAGMIHNRYGAAKVIVTTNTFNHIDDLSGFMSGVALLLAEDAAFVVEVPHSLDLIEKNEFNTIYQSMSPSSACCRL